MRREAVPQRVHCHALRQPGGRTGGAAGGIQHLHVDRLALLPAGKEPVSRPGQSPIGPQNAEQLCRQHDVAVLPALAMLDPDHHPATIDIGDLEADRLGRSQPRCIGCRQRGPRLQARHRLEKPHHLVGVQHHRQLVRLSCIRDPFRDLAMPERHAIEKPQRADRLVQARP
jgi:hypothetical protein